MCQRKSVAPAAAPSRSTARERERVTQTTEGSSAGGGGRQLLWAGLLRATWRVAPCLACRRRASQRCLRCVRYGLDGRRCAAPFHGLPCLCDCELASIVTTLRQSCAHPLPFGIDLTSQFSSVGARRRSRERIRHATRRSERWTKSSVSAVASLRSADPSCASCGVVMSVRVPPRLSEFG